MTTAPKKQLSERVKDYLELAPVEELRLRQKSLPDGTSYTLLDGKSLLELQAEAEKLESTEVKNSLYGSVKITGLP